MTFVTTAEVQRLAECPVCGARIGQRCKERETSPSTFAGVHVERHERAWQIKKRLSTN